MKKFLLSFLFILPLHAEAPDRSITSFEEKPKENVRVDVYDFSGEFPLLENIEIDAKRKKKVEFYLTGDYPLLENIQYNGSFGHLKGELTGKFPMLTAINFLCTSCAMHLDLRGQWQKSCTITVRGMKENIELKLPKDIGIVVHTHVGGKGKVFVSEDLKKKGMFGILKKSYFNELARTSPIVLTLNIETSEGYIILE